MITGPVLVTGAAGFAGSHILDMLAGTGADVVGWYRPSHDAPSAAGGLRWQGVELSDRRQVLDVIATLKPAVVFHCAGAANVKRAWDETSETLAVNVRGTHHLLDALRRSAPEARVLVTSSGMVYAPSDAPLTESNPTLPASPYGLSKLAQEMVALSCVGGPQVLVARPFNHIGPRQSDAFVASAFARQIAEIEAGRREPVMRVGNLEPLRDLMDVRDTVRAYQAIVENGLPGRPYNVCSGRGTAVRDLLEMLLASSTSSIDVVTDPGLYRPNDTPRIVGDAGRLERELGWTPRIPLERTLADLLHYWRSRVAAA